MEQHQNQPQQQAQTQQQSAPPQEPKKKASRGKRIWLIIGIIVGLVAVVGLIIFVARLNSNIWAKVGNYNITKSTYNTLLKELPNRVNDKSNYNAQEDTERTLVLNAGLKTEADRLNVSYTESDINKYLDEIYKITSFRSAAEYKKFLKDNYKWSDETVGVFTENEYLVNRLRGELLAEKSLISTIIRWDTLKLPAAAGLSESSIVETMNNKFLPLYKEGKSTSEIARATDVNPFNSYEINSAAREKNPFTYSQFTAMDSMTQGALAGSFQNYEGLTRDIDEIDKLNKVGDFTQPFKSASGYYVIYRLEEISKGNYTSWDDLIDKYRPISTNMVLGYKHLTQEELSQTANSLSSFFIGEAKAQTTSGVSGTCLGGHAIGFNFSFATQITPPPNYTKVSGGSVSINGIRNNALCGYNNMPNPFYFNGTRFGYSAISSPWEGVNLTGSRTVTSTNPGSDSDPGGDVVYFDCNGGSPTLTITPPPGYEYVQTLLVISRWEVNPDTGKLELKTGIPVVTTFSSFNLSSVRYAPGWDAIDYYSDIANGRVYAAIVQVRPITPPTYDGTVEIAKYREGTSLGQFPAVPSELNNAKVRLTHTPPGTWESSEKTSNPGVYNNIWVNPNNHESNTKGNYRAFVKVPKGWKVVRATNRGASASLNGSCGSEGDCYIGNVTVDNNGTTFIDFFFEPDIEGQFLGACPTNLATADNDYNLNGQAFGWVKDSFDSPSNVRIRIYNRNPDGSPGAELSEATLTSNSSKASVNSALATPPHPNTNNYFKYDIPLRFFDGNNYVIRVFPLRNNAGVGNPPLFYQRTLNCPPPKGAVRCVPSEESGDGIDYIQGWAFDPRKPAGPSFVHFYYDSTPVDNNTSQAGPYNRNDIYGTQPLTDGEITARGNEGYIIGGTRGIVSGPDGKYRFRVPIPDALHDGLNHTLRVYQITEDPASNPELNYIDSPTSGSIQFGPNLPCGVEKWNWPWLQTQNGDVIASGEITGQITGSNLPGARPSDRFEKEAEYLVISMLGGGGPFCSNYDYILTNLKATTDDKAKCDNGTGYGSLSLYSLNESNEDKIFKAVENAFAANGSGVSPNNIKCSPYNTFASLISNPIDTGIGRVQPACLNGSIFKVSGDIGSIAVNSGRNTLFSDGDLNIVNDITYTTEPGGYNDARKVPNLAIVVNGNIKISPTVTRIDAALYATGKIYTCSTSTAQGSPTEICREQLLVNGSLISKDGYLFGRSFTNAQRSPAEAVFLTGQTVAFPPPGLDNLYFSDFNNNIRIDTSEFEPKF